MKAKVVVTVELSLEVEFDDTGVMELNNQVAEKLGREQAWYAGEVVGVKEVEVTEMLEG